MTGTFGAATLLLLILNKTLNRHDAKAAKGGQGYDVPIFPSACTKAGPWGIQEFRWFSVKRLFQSRRAWRLGG